MVRDNSHFVETPSLRVHYRHGGQGTGTLVFIHGNYASSRWWIPQLERLPHGFQALAPDLRGCGGFDGKTQLLQQRNGRLSIHDLADDLAEFLKALKITTPVLVGHSFGGLVVIDYALRYGETVQGIVLEDTGPPDGLPLTDLTQPLLIPLEFGNRRLMRTSLRLVGLPPRGELSEALVEDALASSGQYRDFTRAAGKWSAEKSLPNLHIPTLLIWGSKDRIMPPRIGRRYQRLLPNAEMVLVPRAGHSPHLERPDEFAALLRRFVEKHAPLVKSSNKKKGSSQWVHLIDIVARWLRIK